MSAAVLEEIFVATVRHFAKQKQQAMDVIPSCLYRGACGRKCGYGFWIPDEEYERKFEGNGLSALEERWGYIAPVFRKDLGGSWGWKSLEHEDLAKWLQGAHDANSTLFALRCALIRVAGEFEFDARVVFEIVEWNGDRKTF